VTLHRLDLLPVASGGPAVGAVVFDDASGRLDYERGAQVALASDRARFGGTDREYGRILIESGWSNGQLALIPAGIVAS
jgi:hypothetical protein